MKSERYGVFVSHRGQFEGTRGGTQVCTQEYFETISSAGISLERVLLDVDQRISTRILKRFISTSYFRATLADQVKNLVDLIAEKKPGFVFLNQVNLAHLAPLLRAVLPTNSKIVLLSHGLESTDLLHFIRLRKRLPLSGRARPTAAFALGLAILKETSMRSAVDMVCVLSPPDVVLESWIGAPRVFWLPRMVTSRVLNWKPVGDRVGVVGTLDHAPNLEGLVSVLSKLSTIVGRDIPRVRVIGSSIKIGEWLAATYPFLDYLGPLGENEMLEEVCTWNAFLHPIFCSARGCSTKLAEAIGWGIPVVTTNFGCRGYSWTDGSLVLAASPGEFAEKCLELMNLEAANEAREKVIRVLLSSPSKNDVVKKFADAIELTPN